MPTPRDKVISVRGLRELERDFRKLADNEGGRLSNAIARANRSIVNKIRDVARENYRRIYPYRTPTPRNLRRPAGRRPGLTALGIRSRARAGGASLILAARTRPHILGQEFGSVYAYPQFRRPPVEREPSRALFGVTAGISRGRFLYPAIRSEVPRLAQEYAEIVTRGLLGRL